MNELSFFAMNTEWWIAADCSPGALTRARSLVRREEGRFSRFRPRSLLSQLNRDRAATDPILAQVVRRALRMHRRTMGAFDPGVGAAMIANGYDRTFEELHPYAPTSTGTPPRAQTCVRGSRVTLGPDGRLDLGGIVKGWTVDRAAQLLRDAGCTRLLVDGGGDIRAWRIEGDEWLVGVADGRAVGLTDGAVATSSTARRRWRDTAGGERHHIVEPATGTPAEHEYVEAVVCAQDAATADALATALIAMPQRVLPALPRLHAAALLRDRAGRWSMTPEMERHLR